MTLYRRKLGKFIWLVVIVAIIGCFPLFVLAARRVKALKYDHALSRNDLWYLVHYGCLNSVKLGLVFPCEEVNTELGRGSYAILKVSANHILTVPLLRINGIEEAENLEPDAKFFWQAAWEARRFLDAAAARGLARSNIGIAINSQDGRSQDQMHLHTGCVRTYIRSALADKATKITGEWQNHILNAPFSDYSVLGVEAEDFKNLNPFLLLPKEVRSDPTKLALETIVVIGATFPTGKSGFYLMADRSRPDYEATGERLLDFTCQ